MESSNKDFQASERRLTDAVNSKELELVPVISADNRELLFCRHFEAGGEDIYRSTRAQGRWSQAKSVEELNTYFGNEAPLNISSDGTELIGFVSGEISKSVRGLAGWEAFEAMPGLNIGGWNADAQLVSTKEAYLFASRDDYTDNVDLYVAKVDRNGRILTPELLGPTINTPYAERTPFLHPDMKTLYFSSEGHGGFGGSTFSCPAGSRTRVGIAGRSPSIWAGPSIRLPENGASKFRQMAKWRTTRKMATSTRSSCPRR